MITYKVHKDLSPSVSLHSWYVAFIHFYMGHQTL